MTLDQEVEKVLQRTDAILTKAGYGETDTVYPGYTDEYADKYTPAQLPSPEDSSVQFVDSSQVDENEDDVRFESGIPAGLKEAPKT